MAQRLTRNTFEKGLNTDIDFSKLDPVFATALNNVEITQDGKFFNLTEVKGLTEELLEGSGFPTGVSETEILGSFASKYNIGNAKNVPCITIFLSHSTAFKIYAFDTVHKKLYELFEQTVPSSYGGSSDRMVDAIGYAENGIDYIYFTDNYHELRLLRCEIPLNPSANFLTENDLSLQRLGANGKVVLDSILTGGALLSGTYQFAYRMAEPTIKKFTKWSSLTNPIHVYSGSPSGGASSTGLVYSEIGLPTNQKIRLDVIPTDDELANFNYFQLAVVENIFPEGPESIVEGNNQTFVASLLPIKPIANRLNFDYKTNIKIGTIPIEELVVDLSAIEKAQTLNVKQGRLHVGNVTYRNLEFDNGDPVIGSGSVVTHSSNNTFAQPSESSLYRGYFRDEVYRFGIVYFDKYGNKSPVKVLDMSGVSGNQITSGLIDMRFPSRNTNKIYSIMNSSGQPRSLGLNLLNIHNHPTWAVGFEIVRAKRIKSILTQTPVIPMVTVSGIGALDNYPSLGTTIEDGSGDFEYPDAQPMPVTTQHVPKNLWIPEARNIRRRTGNLGQDIPGNLGLRKKGEAIMTSPFGSGSGTNSLFDQSFSSLAMIFPQNYMYGEEDQFLLDGSEKMKTVDLAIMRLDLRDYNLSITSGDHVNTRIGGTFYALRPGDYFFDPDSGIKTLSIPDQKIQGSVSFGNLAEPASLNNKSIMNYGDLQTEGINLGHSPKIQKCVIIDTPGISASHDIMGVQSRTFANGIMNVRGSSVPLFAGGLLTYENSAMISNKYITEYPNNFVQNSSYVQAVKIANIVRPYGDDRYGDLDAQHEFISTGSKYFFSTAELADVAAGNTVNVSLFNVFGGDCFVSPHTFKISDSNYSVVNQSKNFESGPAPDSSQDLIKKWGVYFLNSGGAAICMPVAVENCATFIQVMLESEYNGAVMGEDVMISETSISYIPRQIFPNSETSLKAPLIYNYNNNLSKQNDQKVYFTRPEFSLEQFTYPSRIHHSDLKLYNSSEQGFDVFRVLNYFDLEENRGPITKLALEGDNFYAIQERGIVYLPMGETQLQQTDAGILAVGTGDVIGRPIIIDSNRGSQHLRTVVESGRGIYMADNLNKAVYRLVGRELQIISDFYNASLFRDKLGENISNKNHLIGLYDPIRKQYWLHYNNEVVSNAWCHRFDENLDIWQGNLDFGNQDTNARYIGGGVFINQNLYLILVDSAPVATIWSMYTGQPSLLGTPVTASATFVVNPEDPISKVFDNMALVASNRLGTLDLVVERESALGNQSVSGTILAVPSKEGTFRIKLPRDSNGARLRGQRMIATIKWPFTADRDPISLSGAYTKYRLSSRTPY